MHSYNPIVLKLKEGEKLLESCFDCVTWGTMRADGQGLLGNSWSLLRVSGFGSRVND